MQGQHHSIKGMPYVPGIACGPLSRAGESMDKDRIAILTACDRLAGPLPAGIIVIDGAPFSHAVIALRSAGIPVVLIDEDQLIGFRNGQKVLIDGYRGLITTDTDHGHTPTPASLQTGQPVRLADGETVYLRASVSSAFAAQMARDRGATSIGLVRTEFLIPPGGQAPDEEYFYGTLDSLCKAASPLPVTLRLLDIASDKSPDWLPASATPGSVLGVQGARLFPNPTVRRVLDAELAAVDSLCRRYDLQLLIPYLTGHEELCRWTRYIRAHISTPIAIGAMAETPAAVLDMHNWFDSTDFVSIGCNDLMQCLFAADRDLPELRDYLDPYAPLLFRFLRDAAERAAPYLQHIQLCGLLPQLHGVLPALVGLGYRAFSVDPIMIPYLADTLNAMTLGQTRDISQKVCQANTSQQLLQAVEIWQHETSTGHTA